LRPTTLIPSIRSGQGVSEAGWKYSDAIAGLHLGKTTTQLKTQLNFDSKVKEMTIPPIQFQQSKELDSFLADRIYEFNAEATGFFDGEEFVAVIRGDSGEIIAGVSGHTWGGCCQVSQLWVHRSARKKGIGRSLMLAVESHALAKQCVQIILASHSFQAPDFYVRLGYKEQARIAGSPNGHCDIHFAKRLD
jgi:ribosomal protein S18 acetylase RimI-like enzyme